MSLLKNFHTVHKLTKSCTSPALIKKIEQMYRVIKNFPIKYPLMTQKRVEVKVESMD